MTKDISWFDALTRAVRANPQMSLMLGIHMGLMLLAASRAKRGKPAQVPPAEAVMRALPAIAASSLLSRRR
jgi:hypothetical protein